MHELDMPINHDYQKPSNQDLLFFIKNSAVIELRSPRIESYNSYYRAGLPGTYKSVFTRQAVLISLKNILQKISLDYSIRVFDAFRTIETQFAIYDIFYSRFRKEFPNLSHADIDIKTREFVVYPGEKSKYLVAPHNSGGAIDLTLCFNGEPLDMGTDFDEATQFSHTSFFEQPYKEDLGYSSARWIQAQRNRRLLFNLMKSAGFTNYHAEWWHYAMYDCSFAKIHGLKTFYPSMEGEVKSEAKLPDRRA